MKSCPACGNQYSDDTLRFCLQDGTPLTDAAQTETPTVVLSETETVAARRAYGRVDVPIEDPASGGWQESRVTQLASSTSPPTSGTGTKLIVAVFGVLLLLALGVVGVSLALLYANRETPAANNGNNANVVITNNASASNSIETPTPAQTFRSPTPAPTIAAGNVPAPTPPINDDQYRGEVSRQVYSWKSKAESRDLNAYMANYASTLDYYLRRNVSAATVRADKARAFSLYSSMRIDISNMDVSISPSGDTATATFDKEWQFDGRDRSQGKVRSQLKFVRSGGRWLITSERDLKLYYKR